MPVSARSRLITIRLTEAEYGLLKDVYLGKGARSLSDYAREQLIQNLLPAPGVPLSFGKDLSTIMNRLNQLRFALQELTSNIENICGNSLTSSDNRHR